MGYTNNMDGFPDVLILDSKPISLIDYLMGESVKPTQTPYGTDIHTSNNQLITIDDPTDMTCTLIHNGGIYYLICFMHDTNEVKFFAHKGYSSNLDDYTTDRTFSANAIKVISGVFYVVVNIATKLGWNKFLFQGYDPRLHQVYNKIVTNSYFLEEIKKFGFTYNRFTNNYFVFTRI